MCFLSNLGCKIIFNVLFNVNFCYQQDSNSLSKESIGWWPLYVKVACWWMVVKIVVKAFMFEHNCRAEGSFWMIQLAVLWGYCFTAAQINWARFEVAEKFWVEGKCFYVYPQVVQAHYRNTDVTLACKVSCITNGYLQRLVYRGLIALLYSLLFAHVSGCFEAFWQVSAILVLHC